MASNKINTEMGRIQVPELSHYNIQTVQFLTKIYEVYEKE